MPHKKPTIALSLKGGGIHAFGAIGLVRLLEENKLKANMVAGSSFGGVVATLYALGFSSDEMTAIVSNWKIWNFLSIRHLHKLQFMSNEACLKVFNHYMADKQFNDLKTKLVLFASSISQGRRALLTKGDVSTALMASCAFPFLYQPVQIGDEQYIDGDFTNSYSCSALKALGAQKVIGVRYQRAISHPTTTKTHRLTPFTRAYHLMMSQIENKDATQDPVDLLIEYPSTGRYFETKKIKECIEMGYTGCKAQEAEILKMFGR